MYLTRLAADPMPVGSGVTARGGPGAVAAALAKIAEKRGVSIRSNERVTHIVVHDGRATGVVLANGDVLSARAVVAAISPKLALGTLTPPEDLPASYRERMLHVRSRGVTAKINVALSGMPAFTALGSDTVPLRGRLLIAPGLDYLERAFDATKYGEMSGEPWLEIAIPSAIDTTLAPAGGHVMSIYAHCAPRTLRRGSWDTVRAQFTDSVLRVLERHAPGIRGQVVAMTMLTPADLEEHWGMSGGHIFHGEHTLDQLWLARPLLGWANYRTPLRGLYLASAGTHPGGALTGLNGMLAADAVLADIKKRVL
jgi:phytoene dehydrogenase-like protein